jgi:Zn-dependent protease with chaperone function
MLLVYAVAFPAFAVFWSEARYVASGLLAIWGGAVGGAVFVLRYRTLGVMGDHVPRIYSPFARLRGSRLALRILGPPEPLLELLPCDGPGTAFHRKLDMLCQTALAPDATSPAVYWSYDERPTARALGNAARPAVAVSLGLLRQVNEAPRLVDVVVLHELAHIRHRDPTIFALVRSYLVAWPVTAAVVGAACLIDLVASADQTIFVALVMLVATLWAVTLATAWLFLLRYAGFLFSLRELHADTAAAAWLGDADAVAATLAASYEDGKALTGRFRSVLSLRLTHLSGGDD